MRLAVLLGLVFAVAGMSAALGQSLFEKLVMPGELIKGHAKLEKDCNNCHGTFSKETQSGLCSGCHKPIAADIAEQKGFHGRNPSVHKNECRHCHTDHKGHQADIILLDRETFRHDMTDFPLRGRHATVTCTACHAPSKPMREAPSACIGCHGKDEPHQGRLGKACDGCHSVDAWHPTKPYDHERTKFSLTGAHKSIQCSTCHANEQWTGLGVACIACHRLKDKHAGRNGPKCESCHSTTKWSAVRFDHDKQTKFPLRGAHRKADCTACHTGNLHDKLPTTCVGCHKSSDPHKGQLGAQCQQCHNETSWRRQTEFDHDLSAFPLIGLHAAVPCESCHVSQDYKGTPKTCGECHNDTRHEGRLGSRCERCHNPNGWKLWRFDHEKQTQFPLTGSHAGLSCHACHSKPHATDLKVSRDCASCHASDDKHRGAFGRACGACHSTNSFSEPMRRN